MSNRLAPGAIFGLVCVAALAVSSAWADFTTPCWTDPSTQPITVPTGLWTFETYGAFANQPKGTREQLYSGTVGLGYYFMPNNSLTLELTGLQGTQPQTNVRSGGFDVLLRTHLINEPGWSIFIDFAPGMLESSDRIPPTGTDFNFSIQTGVGATIHLWGNTDLLTGIRYEHLSNARMDRAIHNPSLNAIQGYVGLLFKL